MEGSHVRAVFMEAFDWICNCISETGLWLHECALYPYSFWYFQENEV